MKKFLVLYRMDMAKMKELMATMTPEDQKKDMAEWGEWMKANMASFADGGAPVGKNMEVSASGSVQKSNDVGGYSILQAETIEEAAKIIATGPHVKMPGATTDVMEIVAMPGM